MICYLIGAGEAPGCPPRPAAGDLVIAADAGLTLAHTLGLTPALTVGDFDSLGHLPTGGDVLRLPVEKDDTDMEAALKIGRERGYHTFYLFGGTGGAGNGLSANHHLYAGHRGRSKPARCWLVLRGAGRRHCVDRCESAEGWTIPCADETPL